MKLKKFISLISVCTLLFHSTAFGADYSTLSEKTAALSASLENGSDSKQIAGEAVILMVENDILNSLTDKGAAVQSFSLKEAADIALKTGDKKSVEDFISKLKQAEVVLSGAVAPTVFSDVSSGNWYYDAVIYSVSNGIFKGMSDTQFAPNMEITRGMFLTLMERMYKKTNVKYKQGYKDIPEDAYYAEAVNWAKANGVLDFITEENFYPDKPITREELVTVLRGCIKLSGKSVDGLTQMKTFTDSSSISDWAKSSVEWAMAEKMVSGFEDGSFRPHSTATRAQVAQIFYNQR